MSDKKNRNKILLRTSWISAIGNAVLSLAKISIGLISGSLAVIGDGIDSATDVVISIVMLYTTRIMSRPPNKKYVYGYEKAESIAAKILSFVIFYAGIQIFISSVEGIFSDEKKNIPGVLAVYVTIFSIVVKLFLSLYQYRQGKKVNSPMLMANAKNMRNDVVISVGVLTGLMFTFIFNLPIFDLFAGLLVSLFIIRSAIGIFMDSSVELMDGVKDTSVYDKIFEAVDKIPEAHNPHRVRSRQIGNMYMIALDVEVDGSMTLNQAHDVAEAIEKNIREAVENVYDIVVHVEPVGKEEHSIEKFGLNKDMIS